jgi:phosphate/sulfate permease
MVMQTAMVNVVRWLMILTAIVLSPLYGLWIAGGMLADARERKRRTS